MIAHLGGTTLAGAMPLMVTAEANLATSAGIALGEVTAQIAPLVQAQISLTAAPPTLAGSLAAVIAESAAISAAIGVGDAAYTASIAAELAAKQAELVVLLGTLVAMQAAVSVTASFEATIETPGIFAYQLHGPVENYGRDLGTQLNTGLGGGPAQSGNGLLLATTSPSAGAALLDLFGIATSALPIRALGNLTLSQLCTAAAQLRLEASASLAAPLGEVSAKISGITDLVASLLANPPTLVTQLAAKADQLLNVQAAIDAGELAPAFDLGLIVSILGNLQATQTELNAKLSFGASVTAALATSGFHLYSLSGAIGEFASDITSELSGGLPGSDPGVDGDALCLVTNSPTATTSLQTFFSI